MKKLALIFFLFLASQATKAQAVYSDTVSLAKTKQQLYQRAKEYFATATTETKHTVTLDDKDTGRIIASSITHRHWLMSGVIPIDYIIKFNTAIAIKEGKYKYVISDISYDKNKVTDEKADSMLKKTCLEIKKFMAEKSNLDF